MKKLLLLLVLVSPVTLFAQTAKELVSEGVELYDNGKYTEALAVYEKARKIDPKDDGIIYEMGLTYSRLKDYTKAIECADKVIAMDTDLLAKAYLLKGSALDYSGKPKDALSVFKKGIKKRPDYYSLYYSVALTSFNQKEYEQAEEALQSCLKLNPLHVNSHYLMGVLKTDEKSKSMLALLNFLIVEPTGKRANVAFNVISGQHKQGVKVEDDNSITVTVNDLNSKDDFSVSDMFLSMSQATNHIEENKGKSDFELFSENTMSFFRELGELQEKNKKTDFWWKFYVGFFYDLAKDKELYETFSYYVYQDVQSTAVETWLQKNPDRVKKLQDWVVNYKRM
jgi:Tfp pilus assembly protein PilF